MGTLARWGSHRWLRRLWRSLPVPVVLTAAIVAQRGVLESRYDVAGHAAEHLTSASAPFLAAALVVLLTWATPHACAPLDVVALAGLWLAATVLVMIGNLRVIDDLVRAGHSHTPTSALPDIADHSLANAAPWSAVVVALALVGICRRRQLIGRTTTIGAAVASALVPPWISPGTIGVVIVTAAVWWRRTASKPSAPPDDIVRWAGDAGHDRLRAETMRRSCSPALCHDGGRESTGAPVVGVPAGRQP